MTRDMLPSELIDRIVDSFASELPDGVFLTLRGRVLDVRSIRGGGWSGEELGGLPWPPMPTAVKWRLAVRSVYETVARGIGACALPDVPDDRHRDPFTIRWPIPDAKVEVTLSSERIAAQFVSTSGDLVLAMPDIYWRGTAAEPRPPVAERDGQPERRYVGQVPDRVKRQDAEHDQELASRVSSARLVTEELQRRNPGTDKDAIRAAFREAVAAHPNPSTPAPDSVMENRIVDAYAAAHGPMPRLRSTLELGRRMRDLVRIIHGTHPDFPADDDDGNSSDADRNEN